VNGSSANTLQQIGVVHTSALCPACGLPRDYEHFDESGFAATPGKGREVVLARFELAPQYCGLLENFSQFTDLYGRDFSQVETPALQWIISVNRRPLYPWVQLEQIVNPWGYGSFGIAIRLDENATVEFVVRNSNYNPSAGKEIKRLGGRITGRFWYNPAYGDATPPACHTR
jgi:hypothetical protein